MKRYLLTEAAFISGVLLAAGSIITDNDLPTFPHPSTREPTKLAPPSSSIEIDEAGNPVDEADTDILAAFAGEMAPAPVMPVSPVGVGATKAQSAPSQPPGGLQLAEQSLPSGKAPFAQAVEAQPPQRRSRSAETAERAASAASDSAQA